MLPLPSQHQLPEVYDRSGNPNHADVDGLLFASGRKTQSAEMNELQQYMHRRIDNLGGAIFSDGDVTDGGNPVFLTDVEGKNVRIHAGKVFLQGKIYEFDTTELLIPVDERVSLGVRRYTEIVDFTADPGLLGPAVRRSGFGEPGAYRTKSWIAWGFKGESGANDGGDGEFFPVYSVDNGVIIEENASPMVELVYKALRRYDYDGNGSYVSSGLRVQFIQDDDDAYDFQLEAGAAHILGDIVERKSDSRLTYTKDPDELTATNEYHLFTPDVNGKMNVVLSRPPISTVASIIGQKEKTVTLTRGQTSGGKDIIDPTISSVVSILSVTKGGTTYAATTDYVRDGDEISWAPGGIEPTAGETYNVTFRYMDSVGVPEDIQPTYIVVSGYVSGQSLLITYNYKLPRIDLIVMKHDGTINRIKGTAALQNPAAPQAGPNEIALATVEYDWFYPPTIRNVAVRAVHMSDLEDMRANIFDLYRLVGQERLRNDANQKDPTAKLGVFVDAFKDDSMRDNGISQTAAIVDGFLMLPIQAEILTPDALAVESHQTLTYSPVVEIQQTLATQCGLINPYQSVAPPDGKLTLSPNADAWSIFTSQFNSRLTALLVRSGLVTRLDAVDARRERRLKQLEAAQTGVEVLTQDDIGAELSETGSRGIAIRQRVITVKLEGFQPEEKISEARFDGVHIAALEGLEADLDGKITANFTIPPNVPTGVKLVFVQGDLGTYAETIYSASFNVIPNPPPRRRRDPLAQTFVPREDMQVCGVDVKFCKKGPTLAPVIVQLREVVNGYPGANALAESTIEVSDMAILNAKTSTTTLAQRCYIRSNSPTTNYDTGTDVLVGHSNGAWMYRGLLKFDLPSDIAGATIFSARLSMRKKTGGGFSVKASRLTQEFQAASATWNNRQTATAWSSPGGTYVTEAGDGTVALPTGKNQMVAWDIKNLVQQWAGGQPNHGLILRSTEEGLAVSAKSATLDWSSVAPQLEIIYKPAGGGIMGEGWTRALFPLPSFVRGGTEYCFTLLTTDPGHSVSFARLGDVMEAINNNGQTGFVSQQPYPDGVLFDSSNNTTWTARQKDDMTFRILRAHYDTTSRVVDLGNVAVTNVSDLMIRGLADRYTGDTRISFDVTPPGGAPTVNVENMETLPLSARITGNVNVKAKINGTNRLSPILYANTLVVAGNIADTGSYFTRKIKAAATFNATVIFKAFLPSGASIQAAIANATYASGNRVVTDGVHQFTWLNMTLDRSEAADEGYVEQTWKVTGAKGVTLENMSQVRLVLNGGPNARLLVKDFQFFTK